MVGEERERLIYINRSGDINEMIGAGAYNDKPLIFSSSVIVGPTLGEQKNLGPANAKFSSKESGPPER
ncbi:conserved hypothetical protein [Ricinus communis]|uniref:Uncharacterized protein n=1 Tax=Ricinus communis TaxID=3988 RepID=B9RP06_RICCO|nr:conserved hypothetical protein [Ricinus communis]